MAQNPKQSNQDKEPPPPQSQREADAVGDQEKAARTGFATPTHTPPEGTTLGVETGQSAMRPTFPPLSMGDVYDREAVNEEGEHKSVEELAKLAEEREKAAAVSRGMDANLLADYNEKTGWFVSNRIDDRVAVFERDERHPGGELFLAGSAPDRGYRTASVEQALMQGLIIEVPEPKRTMRILDENGQHKEVRNRKYPVETSPDPGVISAAQPGQPTPIGRRLDPALYDEDAQRQVARVQRSQPRAIPVAPGGFVPKRADVDKPS